MNCGTILDIKPGDAPAESAHFSAAKGRARRIPDGLRDWQNLAALGVVCAGFALRASAAFAGFLNPDEALHYIILNQRSVDMAYRVSLTNAHPPLIYLLVYFWSFLGRSEFMLRFPSVLAGTGFCWLMYKWIGSILGRAAGMAGLILTAFSPVMIALSAELRAYSVLLFCEAAAVFFLERALAEHSSRKMVFFSLFLYLAILSHYSAMFFAAAAGIYALAYSWKLKPRLSLLKVWAISQAGALMIYAFLYVTHVSKLKQYVAMWAVSFDQVYSTTDHQNLARFTFQRTKDIFTFLFNNPDLGPAMLLVWVVAIVLLLSGSRAIPTVDHSSARRLGILLFAPIVAVWGAGVARLYPYVGSRHTVFLAPFIIAAAGLAISALSRRNLWIAIALSAGMVVVSSTSGKLSEPFIAKEDQSRALMAQAVDDLRGAFQPGDVIITDYQSTIVLVYYLCGPKLILPVSAFNRPASRVKCNGFQIGSFQTWDLQPEFFLANFASMAQAQRMQPGSRIWVVQTGWGVTFAKQISRTSPQFTCLGTRNFGRNIAITPFLLNPDGSPGTTRAELHCSPI